MSKYIYIITLILLITVSCQTKSNDWVTIFNGKNLDGWKLAQGKNGKAEFKVVRKAIQGTAKKVYKANSFLCTEKEYANFILEFEVKLQEPLNSGVQVRSKSLAEKNNYRVHGPQVEVAGDKRGFSGYIYGEAIVNARGGKWLTPTKNKIKHRHFRPNKWNKYKVKAVGNTISTWINGKFVNKTTHPLIPAKGFIGLQVHSIKKGGPYKVLWKKIRIKELK